MNQTSRRCGWMVVVQMVFATAALTAAEPLRPLRMMGGDLGRQEREIRATPRGQVSAEVTARAAEMGVRAPIPRLVDLLFERTTLALAIDRCAAAAEPCLETKADLARVEAEFRTLTGVSTAEFRAGHRKVAAPPAPPVRPRAINRLLGELGEPRTNPYHCVCGVSVYSLDRWMNPYWGLECGRHSGHGVCSNNVDTFVHSPGHGAMTGDVSVYFGTFFGKHNCPDDHQTCFKGPAAGGEWGNVCSCDTIHSQFYDPTGAWYGGNQTDSSLVYQASFNNMTADGPCDPPFYGIAVAEYAEEHDPHCCDDPMGTLMAYGLIGEGTHSVDVPASAQNCNGGSQSGVPPYCGTFGATIRIVSTCTTLPDDNWASCSGHCGEMLTNATCHCDFECHDYGDCCQDYCDSCSGPEYVNTGCLKGF